jgi:hypothetical protein
MHNQPVLCKTKPHLKLVKLAVFAQSALDTQLTATPIKEEV